MSQPVSLQNHKLRKAALRGFREWKRLLPSLSYLDETARLMDLPDELILFFCCKHTPKLGPDLRPAHGNLRVGQRL